MNRNAIALAGCLASLVAVGCSSQNNATMDGNAGTTNTNMQHASHAQASNSHPTNSNVYPAVDGEFHAEAFTPEAIDRAMQMTPEGQFLYVYYPDSEVYFAPDRGLYFWNNGQRWLSGRDVPANVELNQTNRVMFPLSTTTPYRVHASIASAFPAEGNMNTAAAGNDRP